MGSLRSPLSPISGKKPQRAAQKKAGTRGLTTCGACQALF